MNLRNTMQDWRNSSGSQEWWLQIPDLNMQCQVEENPNPATCVHGCNTSTVGSEIEESLGFGGQPVQVKHKYQAQGDTLFQENKEESKRAGYVMSSGFQTHEHRHILTQVCSCTMHPHTCTQMEYYLYAYNFYLKSPKQGSFDKQKLFLIIYDSTLNRYHI